MHPSLPATVLATAILGLALPFSPSRGATPATAMRSGPTAAVELSAAPRMPTASPAVARQQPASWRPVSSAGAGVPYQEQGPSLAGLLLRSAGALALVTVLAVAAALLAKRYMPGLKGFSAAGTSRVQLLESKRITPRLTLFVVEFEGRRLLLAQSGDRIVEVGASAGETQSAGA